MYEYNGAFQKSLSICWIKNAHVNLTVVNALASGAFRARCHTRSWRGKISLFEHVFVSVICRDFICRDDT